MFRVCKLAIILPVQKDLEYKFFAVRLNGTFVGSSMDNDGNFPRFIERIIVVVRPLSGIDFVLPSEGGFQGVLTCRSRLFSA